MYDDKHRVLPISLVSEKFKPIQKGIREKLLCGCCEVKLSVWESTLKKDLVDFGNRSSNYLKITQLKENIYKFEGIKYLEFKLAVLSLIWRMSISSRDLYAGYDLGSYNDTIREILDDSRHTASHEFSIIVSRYELDGEFLQDIQMGFPKSRSKQFTIQQFIIWGHCFTIFINNKSRPNLVKEAFLSEAGILHIAARNYSKLSGHKSVLARISDDDVVNFYNG